MPSPALVVGTANNSPGPIKSAFPPFVYWVRCKKATSWKNKRLLHGISLAVIDGLYACGRGWRELCVVFRLRESVNSCHKDCFNVFASCGKRWLSIHSLEGSLAI